MQMPLRMQESIRNAPADKIAIASDETNNEAAQEDLAENDDDADKAKAPTERDEKIASIVEAFPLPWGLGKIVAAFIRAVGVEKVIWIASSFALVALGGVLMYAAAYFGKLPGLSLRSGDVAIEIAEPPDSLNATRVDIQDYPWLKPLRSVYSAGSGLTPETKNEHVDSDVVATEPFNAPTKPFEWHLKSSNGRILVWVCRTTHLKTTDGQTALLFEPLQVKSEHGPNGEAIVTCEVSQTNKGDRILALVEVVGVNVAVSNLTYGVN